FPKTVLLTMKDANGRPTALGSGFVLKKGFVVSNFHVIEGSASGFAKRVGDSTRFKIAGIAAKDEARDLVILAVDGLTEEGATLSKRPTVEVGETVFAVGNPRGLEGTFSQGIVSSIREFDRFSLLQITAPISPGSSGGPIVDENGDVVGIAVATFRGGQNLNFAIPIKFIIEVASAISTNTAPLAEKSKATAGKTLFDDLQAGKSTDGVTAGSFLWSGSSPNATLGNDGTFTLSLRNNLDSAIRDVVVLVLFYDRTGNNVDFTVVGFDGPIPTGMAKRVPGAVDASTKQLTTPTSDSNQFMYSDRPNTKIEFRTLGFTIAE